MPLPWKRLSSKQLADFRIFKVRSDVCENPLTHKPGEFFVIESVNWVNVIAVTPDDKLVMVEQYRFGSNTVELEIPGGMMDPHENDPVASAVRELREETGYEGDNARVLGDVFSNPAIMNNSTFTVIVENCHLRHDTEFGSGALLGVGAQGAWRSMCSEVRIGTDLPAPTSEVRPDIMSGVFHLSPVSALITRLEQPGQGVV